MLFTFILSFNYLYAGLLYGSLLEIIILLIEYSGDVKAHPTHELVLWPKMVGMHG